MYVYTDVQVQSQNLNTNKQIEAIINNELHCMSCNLFNFVLKHLQGDTQKTHRIRLHFGTFVMEQAMLNT